MTSNNATKAASKKEIKAPSGELYVVYDNHRKMYFQRSNKPNLYAEWVPLDEAIIYRGENARSRAYSSLQFLRNEQRFANLTVKKFSLYETEDI